MSNGSWKSGLHLFGEFLCILAVSIGLMIFAAAKQDIDETPVVYRISAIFILIALCIFNFDECDDIDKKQDETISPIEPESPDEKLKPLERSLYVFGEISMIVSFFMFFGIDYFQLPLWWRFIAAIPICVSISNVLNLKKSDLNFKENVKPKVIGESVKHELKPVSESSAEVSGIKRELGTVVESTAEVSGTKAEHVSEPRQNQDFQTGTKGSVEPSKKSALQTILELRSRKIPRKGTK